MKTSVLFLLTAALAVELTACVNTEREIGTTTQDPRATYTPPPASARTRVGASTVLNTVRATHTFSNAQTPDNFVLQLRGPRVLNSQAHLIVTNAGGDTLRHEVLPARALIDDKLLADPQAATVRDKEIAILRKMNTFFAPERFIQPALPPTAEPPAEIDLQAWKALREDPSNVAFDYTGAGGIERRLAYVRKLGKTLVINQ